jgi:hypothetical protein
MISVRVSVMFFYASLIWRSSLIWLAMLPSPPALASPKS